MIYCAMVSRSKVKKSVTSNINIRIYYIDKNCRLPRSIMSERPQTSRRPLIRYRLLDELASCRMTGRLKLSSISCHVSLGRSFFIATRLRHLVSMLASHKSFSSVLFLIYINNQRKKAHISIVNIYICRGVLLNIWMIIACRLFSLLT